MKTIACAAVIIENVANGRPGDPADSAPDEPCRTERE